MADSEKRSNVESSQVDVTSPPLESGVLIAIAYDDPRQADDVLAAVRRLQNAGALHLNNAVAVARKADGGGRIKVDWDVSRTVAGLVVGVVLGALAGLIVLSRVTSGPVVLWPLVGAIFGALAGGWAGTFADSEHIDDFVLEVRETMPRGSSALLMLLEQEDPEKTIAALRPYGGRLIRTTLPAEEEDRLRAALDRTPQAA